MKIDRLIGILTILLRQDRITAPTLAKHFEVSTRTIHRDIETLCKAGIPLISTQGYGGGISIAAGYKIDKALFSREELQTILVGLRGLDTVSNTSIATAFIEKLSTREHPLLPDAPNLLDLSSHAQTPLTQKIQLLKSAIIQHETVSFQYYYEKGESYRIVEPYHILFQWSSWYLLAYCLERVAFRLFKLNRLWNVQPTGQSFTARQIPPEAFPSNASFSHAQMQLQAIFLPCEKYRLIEEYGIDCFTVLEDGRLFFERGFTSYTHMQQWIFSFGDKVEILNPEKLRIDRATQSRNILHQQHDI